MDRPPVSGEYHFEQVIPETTPVFLTVSARAIEAEREAGAAKKPKYMVSLWVKSMMRLRPASSPRSLLNWNTVEGLIYITNLPEFLPFQ